MNQVNFDLEGARQANFSDAQIAEALAKRSNFDIAGARAAKFTDTDIISRLTAPQQARRPAAPIDDGMGQMEDPGAFQAGVIGVGRTFDRVSKGMQQLYHGARGNDAELAKLKETAAEDDKHYAVLQKQHPIATAVGETIPSLVIPAGGGATALATAGRVALASAIPSALEYGTAQERATRAATSAAGGVVGGVVAPKVAGMVAKGGKNALRSLVGEVTPEALALAAKAKSMGVEVNVAQLGDSKFLKTLASSLEQMPFTGMAQKVSKQRGDFTRAVSKTFGEDTDKITPAVYGASRKRLGEEFDNLAMRNTLNLDEAAMTRLDGVLNDARALGDDGTIRAINSMYDRVVKQSVASTNEVPNVAMAGVPRHMTTIEVPGAAYSSMDRELGKLIKNGGEKGRYAKDMQNVLRDAMDKSIPPADKEAWDLARSQYRNLKAVRDTVAREGGDGNIPPTMLMNSLNNSEAGKEAMAMGVRGQLGELGQIGKRFVRDTVPNSGTAQRAMAMGLIGGSGFAFGATPEQIAGMLAGGATAGRVMTKVLSDPKVIANLAKANIPVSQLMNLPPSAVARILGAAGGRTIAEMNQE